MKKGTTITVSKEEFMDVCSKESMDLINNMTTDRDSDAMLGLMLIMVSANLCGRLTKAFFDDGGKDE